MNQKRNRPSPPSCVVKLLSGLHPADTLEEVEGDLAELYAYWYQRDGKHKANIRYLWSVLSVLPPFVRRRQSKTVYANHSLRHLDMFRNYLTIALRSLWRNKGYATIHIAGLAVAFCVSVFLFLTAYLQLTFDSFHEDGERIFQTYYFTNYPEKAKRTGNMPLPLQPALKSELAGLEGVARVITTRKSAVEYQGNYFEKEVILTDPDFFQIFSFPMRKGSQKTALEDPGNIVISESMAKTVFGDDDPMGKVVQVKMEGSQKPYIVTGVLADAPYNSSIRYDALIRAENFPAYHAHKDSWDNHSHRVFLKLAPHTDQAKFEDRLKFFVQKYYAGALETLRNEGVQPDQRGDLFAIRLQKLADVHFDREVSDGKGAPIALIYVLLGIAFFILLIACINFINLSVARSFTRAREVGVRKTLGAQKGQLFMQIWGESTMICWLSFLMSSMLAYWLLPEFNAMFNLRLDLTHMLQSGFIALMGGVFIGVTLFAGGYPAWLMSRFNPVEVLKGKVSLKRPGVLRNSLLVTQFAMSSLFICCTVIALQQLDYLRQAPLGFEKEQVISIPVNSQMNGRQVLERMRNRLASDPTVLALTGSSVNLGKGKDRVTSRTTTGFTYQGKDISTDWLLVDYDYLKTLQIPLIAGREFDPAYPSDSLDRVIITERMAKIMGEKPPVGEFLQIADTKFLIIGVVPDFHLYSVADDQRPITMHLAHTEPINYIFVRVSPESLKGAMDKLKQVWQNVAPGTDFMASFLDENINAWYENEEKMSQIFTLAAGIAILLSCSGLFAIALLMTEQRIKEIGIRKVLGADMGHIIILLSKDFIKLVGIALVIAIPLAWFLMQMWLDHYPYRIELSGWVFAGVGMSVLFIALITVSFQSIKAALMNPVKSLRSE